MGKRLEHRFNDGLETKRCYVCKEWLSVELFNRNNRTWDELECLCRDCQKVIRSTPRRASLNAYRLMMNRVNNRNGNFPQYKEKGIICTIDKEDFIRWYSENYFPNCMVDRVDDDGNYALSNVQMLSKAEHNAKGREDRLARYGITEKQGERFCYGCEQIKQLDAFGIKANKINSKTSPDGHDEHCKECRREQRRDHYKRKKHTK